MWNSAPSLQSIASASLIVALICGIIAAGAGAIGTWASNRAGDIEKRQAQVQVAKANARAEEATLETQRLKVAFSWRRLTPKSREILRQKLAGVTRQISVETVFQDPEASMFWDDVAAAFKSAGCDVLHITGGWERVLGVHVYGNDNSARGIVVDALTSADIEVVAVGPAPKGSEEQITVIIGSNIRPHTVQ